MLSLPYIIQSKLLQFTGMVRYRLLERHYIHTVRIGIVLTTLLLTSFVALLLVKRETLGLILLGVIAGAVALVLIYHALEYGVFLLIVISTVIDPPLPRDLSVTLLFLMVMLGLWFFRLLIADRSVATLRPAPFNRFALIFIIAVVISYIWSTFYVDPEVRYFQEDKFLPRTLTGLVLIFSPLAVLLYANLLRSVKDIKRLVWYFVIFGVVVAVPESLRLELPAIINNGGQLPAWVSILALGQVLFNAQLKLWQRIVLVGAVGLWTYVQIGLGISWLSGWVPMVGGVAIVVLMRSRLAFLLVVLMVSIYVVANFDTVNELLADEQEVSGDTRAEAGNLTIEYANQHFLFGTGPAGYYFYMTIHLNYMFQLSHNNYIDIYAQTGVVGFIAWILMWLSVGWTIFKAAFARPQSGFVKGLSVSLLAMYCVTLVIMMLGDWVTPFTYTQTLHGISYTIWPWVWAGTGIALYHLVKNQPLAANADANPGA